jgi:hypothetical protein
MAVAGVGVALGLVALSGCGEKYTEPFRDSPRSGTVNRAPADVIEMPDGFNNLSTKCDHGNRLYVTYHADAAYGSVTVVKGDPSCR